MRLGGKVNNGRETFLFKELSDKVSIADIALRETDLSTVDQ